MKTKKKKASKTARRKAMMKARVKRKKRLSPHGRKIKPL